MAAAHVRLEGGRRAPKRGAVRVGDVEPGSPIEVTVTVRPHGQPDDFETVKRTLGGFGLSTEAEYPATGSLIMRGTAAQVQDAFRAGLGMYSHRDDGLLRGREGHVHIPAELEGIVTGVFGLDQRRVARRSEHAGATHADPAQAGATQAAKAPAAKAPPAKAPPAKAPLGPAELERRYRFPAGDGAGQTIAIAEFGGGYFPDDVRAFCQSHGRAVPHIDTVSIGYSPMTPTEIAALSAEQQGPALGASHEVMMDVEIVAGLCPGANISVFFAPFDQKGWIDLLDRVVAADPVPVALSLSWGLAEDSPDWSAAAMDAINQRLRAASERGITVCAATGDDGSGDQMHDASAHVHFPASSPFVLAVGGTMLAGNDEVVWWNAPGDRSQHGGGSTGGGVSVKFPRPEWQTVKVDSRNAGAIEGRVVPDVAALAGPPGYSLVFDGQVTLNGGTSAAAPLWAALIARIAAAKGGRSAPAFLTPLLYAEHRAGTAFTDITKGNNASPQPGFGYDAGRGFDAVSGWGAPDGESLLAALG
jgi:kumamolisin